MEKDDEQHQQHQSQDTTATMKVNTTSSNVVTDKIHVDKNGTVEDHDDDEMNYAMKKDSNVDSLGGAEEEDEVKPFGTLDVIGSSAVNQQMNNSQTTMNNKGMMMEDKTKLFVGQIPKSWDSERVGEFFGDYQVLTCSIITDRHSGKHCSCAFVKFANEREAQRVIDTYHNKFTLPGMRNPLQVKVASHSTSRNRSNSSTNSSMGRNSDLASSASGGLFHGFGSFSSASSQSASTDTRYREEFNPEIHELTKIFVVNRASLNESEISTIFSEFGAVQSVLCLPQPRYQNPGSYSPQNGFTKYCFIITFESHAEAQKAINAIVRCPKTDAQMTIKWSKRQVHKYPISLQQQHLVAMMMMMNQHPQQQQTHQPAHMQQFQPSQFIPSEFNAAAAAGMQGVPYPGAMPPSQAGLPFIQMNSPGQMPMQPMYFVPMEQGMMGFPQPDPMMMMQVLQQQQQAQQPGQPNQQQSQYPTDFANQMFIHSAGMGSYVPTNGAMPYMHLQQQFIPQSPQQQKTSQNGFEIPSTNSTSVLQSGSETTPLYHPPSN